MTPAEFFLWAAPLLLLMPLLLDLAAARGNRPGLLPAAEAALAVSLALLAPLLLAGVRLAGWLPDAPDWLLPSAAAVSLATIATIATRLLARSPGAAPRSFHAVATAPGLLAAGFLSLFGILSLRHAGPLPAGLSVALLIAGLLLAGAGALDLALPAYADPVRRSRWRRLLLALLLPPLAWFTLTQKGPALPPAPPLAYMAQSPMP